MVVDAELVDALELPARGAQAKTKLELLEGMQIAIRNVAHPPDRLRTVKPAAAEMVDVTGCLIGLASQLAGAVFDGRVWGILEQAADARKVVFGFQSGQTCLDEARLKLHIAVHQVDEISLRMLKAQLRSAAAAAIG